MIQRDLYVSSVASTFVVTVRENEDPMKSVIIDAPPTVRYGFKGQILGNLIKWLEKVSADVKICSIPQVKEDRFRYQQ